jgi:hypothetical protein
LTVWAAAFAMLSLIVIPLAHAQGKKGACDGTVQIRNGKPFHQCYCGNAGFISGTIENFDGKQSMLTSADTATKIRMEPAKTENSDPPASMALPLSANTALQRSSSKSGGTH